MIENWESNKTTNKKFQHSFLNLQGNHQFVKFLGHHLALKPWFVPTS